MELLETHYVWVERDDAGLPHCYIRTCELDGYRAFGAALPPIGETHRNALKWSQGASGWTPELAMRRIAAKLGDSIERMAIGQRLRPVRRRTRQDVIPAGPVEFKPTDGPSKPLRTRGLYVVRTGSRASR